MKALFSLLFILCSIVSIQAQCPNTNVILVTQAEVDNFIIQYPSCTNMPYGITVRGAGITNLNGLSNLTEIQGSLKIGEYTGGNAIGTSITNLQGLNSLTSVGFLFNVLYNDNLINLSGLDALTTVGASFQVNSNIALQNFSGANTISTIGGSFNLGGNDSLTDCNALGSVTSIGGNISVTYNDVLANLDGLDNLSSFSGDLLVRNNPVLDRIMHFNPGVISMNEVGIYANDMLTDISGLASVETFTYHFSLNNNILLEDLTGLQNVVHAEGNLDISDLDLITHISMNALETVNGILIIESNPLLEDFSFNNLTSVLNLTVNFNDSLLHVDGFSAITQLTLNPPFETAIGIGYNPSLVDISGISNIDLTNLQWLYLRSNTQLSLCDLLNVCQYIRDGRNYIITNNGTGCESFEDFIVQCEASYNTITGIATYDANNNGCDAADLAVSTSMISVSTTNGMDLVTTYPNTDGIYTLFVREGPYATTLTPSVNSSLYTIDPTIHNSNFTGSGNTDMHDFCISPNSPVSDIQIVIVPEEDARPGFDTVYHILVENVGTNTETGSITFEFDDTKQAFVSASEVPVSETSNLLTFDYSDFQAFQTIDITVILNTFAPPIVEGGDVALLIATLTTSDINVSNNVYTLEQIVVNSFDPNDKQVMQGETLLIDDIGDFLDYRIRFQNTGTADAITVRVTDALSDKLDWSTFQPVMASHDYRVQINDPQFIEFIFDDIYLPAEQDDEPGSHGFVTFRIKPKNDVVVGDIITGDAKIYFDYNAPIITNTVETEIINSLSITEYVIDNQVFVFPNPAHDVIQVVGLKTQEPYAIYDLQGRLILKGVYDSNEHIHISQLTNGLYFLKFESGESFRFVKE